MMIFKKSMLKNIIVSVLVIGAASSVIADPVGNVAVITHITQTKVGGSTEFSPGVTNSVAVAQGLIDSNTPDGFKITVVSTNGGVMIRTGGIGGGPGSTIAYTGYELKAVAGGKIGLGGDPWDTKTLDLGKKGIEAFTSGPVKSATVLKPYQLLVKFTPSDNLLSGEYTDTITITMVAGS